ncbi:recombinase family protein [Rhodoferax sp.]|jgi:DNA invertase Pin-like site-specific DNA recombinase|uniref:recombinase family protein n=1 Tax=Rhodoferax sp. TaxID=50421 RepID=UPI003784643A
MLIGYARVSTTDQDCALQIDALTSAGVTTIYRESGSGVGPRPQLRLALSKMKPTDVLTVWKIDRVARSLSDLLAILAQLKASGAAVRSLTEPIDTTTPLGEFTFQILGAAAQLERSIIRERVMAGQAAARCATPSIGQNVAGAGSLPTIEHCAAPLAVAAGRECGCWDLSLCKG